MKLNGLEPQWVEFDGAKFHVRPLSWSEVLELGVLLQSGDLKAPFEFACNTALEDWEGIENNDGPAKFSREAIAQLPVKAVAFIAKHVIDTNILGAPAEKN